jgi:hypothetical protein
MTLEGVIGQSTCQFREQERADAALAAARERVMETWRARLKSDPGRLCRILYAGMPLLAVIAERFLREMRVEGHVDLDDEIEVRLDGIETYAGQFPQTSGREKNAAVTAALEEYMEELTKQEREG